MKYILNFQTVDEFTSAYTGNPDAIPTPVPGIAYVAENKDVKYNPDGEVIIQDYQGNEMMSFPMPDDGTPFKIPVTLFEELDGSTPPEGNGERSSFYLEVDKDLIDAEKCDDTQILEEEMSYGSDIKLGVFIPAMWTFREDGQNYTINFSWGQETPNYEDVWFFNLYFKKGVIKDGRAVITARKPNWSLQQ